MHTEGKVETHASVWADPLSCLSIDSGANEASTAPSGPNLPECPLRNFLKHHISGQPAQGGEFKHETTGTRTAGLRYFRRCVWIRLALTVFGVIVQRRVGVKWYAETKVDARIRYASWSVESREQPLAQVVG